jgi:hypothetical protein
MPDERRIPFRTKTSNIVISSQLERASKHIQRVTANHAQTPSIPPNVVIGYLLSANLIFREALERSLDVLVVHDNTAFRTASLGAELGAQIVDVDGAVLEVWTT